MANWHNWCSPKTTPAIACPTGSCWKSPRSCRAWCNRRPEMSQSSRKPRQPKPFEVALAQLQKHYLLGPVAGKVHFYAASKLQRVEMPKTAYCQIEGHSTIVFNDALKLDATHWLGVLALATLVLAVGAPRRLPVPAALSDL